MARVCLYRFVYSIVILLAKGNGNTYQAPCSSASACCGSLGLAPASEGAVSSPARTASENPEDFSRPPFQRSALSCTAQVRDGVECAERLDVRYMQKDAFSQCLVLRPLWTELGNLCCYWEPAQDTVLSCPRVCPALARTAENQESPATQSSKISEEKQARCSAREPVRPKARPGLRSRWIILASACSLVSPTSSTWTDRLGKGCMPMPMNMASPPPPPPPMLMAQHTPHGMPWMQQNMPMMSAMPFMPPTIEAHVAAQPPPLVQPPEVVAEAKVQSSAPQKLNKIMKAVKKEDNLSPEFQQLLHTEMKKDDRESTGVLLEAVKEHGDAKEALLEIESARLQLWSQWRVFFCSLWSNGRSTRPNFKHRRSHSILVCKRLPII